MDDCRYSIIPTPKNGEVTCACCGNKIEGLPYYTQIERRFLCTEKKGEESWHLGLGFGVPMCDDCDEDITNRMERSHKLKKALGIVLAIAIATLVSLARNEGGAALAFIMVAVILYFLFKRNDVNKYSVNPDIIADKGFDKIKPAFDILAKNGWREFSPGNACHQSGEKKFRGIVCMVCATGEFSILDNKTGNIVDYKDDDALSEVYENSVWHYYVSG